MTEDEAVFLDYCEDHGILVEPQDQPSVVRQTAYELALTSPPDSLTRALAVPVARRGDGDLERVAFGPNGLRVPSAGRASSRGCSWIDVQEEGAWAKGDPLREHELIAAYNRLTSYTGHGSERATWPDDNVDRLWRAFTAAASACGSEHPRRLREHPWPGADGIVELLTTTSRVVVNPAYSGNYVYSSTISPEVVFSDLVSRTVLYHEPGYAALTILSFWTSYTRTADEHLFRQRVRAVVDTLWPVLDPPSGGVIVP